MPRRRIASRPFRPGARCPWLPVLLERLGSETVNGNTKQTTSQHVPDQPLRVAVLGAAGRMGRAVCSAIEVDPRMTLFARLDAGEPGIMQAMLEFGA